MAHHVPTPDEIVAILAARKAGLAPPSNAPRQKDADAIQALQTQVNEMMEKKIHSPDELRLHLQDMQRKHGCDPLEEMVRIVMEKRPDGKYVLGSEARVRVLEMLNSYSLPKLRSMEITGKMDVSHTINIVRFGDDGSIRQEKLKNGNAPIEIPIVRISNG